MIIIEPAGKLLDNTKDIFIIMTNSSFQFIMKNPPSICLGGGVLLALCGNPLGAAALLAIGFVLATL